MPDIWDDIATNVAAGTSNLATNSLIRQKRNPALTSRARKLSQKYGISSALVEEQPEIYEAQERKETAEVVFEKNPWMPAVLAEDPDIGGMLGDEDLPKIDNILGAFGMTAPAVKYDINLPRTDIGNHRVGTRARELKRVPWTAKDYATRLPTAALGAFGEAATRTAQGVMGGAELVADLAGFDEETDAYFRREQAIGEKILDNMRPEWMDETVIAGGISANDVQSGVASTIQMLLPLPFGKAAILPVLAGTTGLAAYGKYQDRGASIGQSLIGGAAEGAIEYATEAGPMKYLTGGNWGKSGIGGFIKNYVLQDIIGEQIATAGQDAVDTAIANPKTWAEYWQERPEAAMSTLVATLTTSALVGGGGKLYQRFGRVVDDARDSNGALHGQAILDHIMTGAENVELRTTSPEAFAKFINEGAANSPVKNVYVPIEAIDAALADEALPEEEKAALTLFQTQIEEARLNGGDVVIPIGDAAATFAGTKLWQSLKDESRVIAGGISGREAREKMEGLIEELEAVGNEAFAEAKEAGPAISAKAAVYDDVKAQMIAAGRSTKEAQTTALLVASRAETLASRRYGKFKTPEEAWKWMQLQVVGPDAKVGKSKKLQQAPFKDVTKLLDRDDWALLTAANPDAQQLSPEENTARNEELKQALDEMGLKYHPSRGVYDNEEPSFAVEGITEEQARALGARFGQDSVLTRRGFIYRDGSVHRARSVAILDADADNYFTELPDGTKFAIDIDFSAKVPLGGVGQAGWTDTRIDGMIKNFGQPDGSSQAVAVMMSPDQFLGLTASARGRELIDQRISEMDEYGPLEIAKLISSGSPSLTVSRGGEPSNVQRSMGVERLDDRVMAHDGRHRMAMLKAAGVTQVPVIVILQDGKKQPLPAAPTILHLAGQRSRSDQVANGDIDSFDVAGVPISEPFRSQLQALGISAPTTLQQSDLPSHEVPSSIEGVLQIARSEKFASQRDFKAAVQAAVNAYKGNKRDRKRLFRLALNDARVALRDNANAVGWYDEKVTTALSVFAAIHPEIETDENAKFAFIYALAVTSNGLKVDANFKLADKVYRQYKKLGKMPSTGEGTAAEAMSFSFDTFNTLVDKMGIDALREYMQRSDVTAGQVEKHLGVEVGGEGKNTTVTGAAFLGPKIGNGFFSNLYGNFDQLTMDRWFIRTWGRWTGTLIVTNPTVIKEKRAQFDALIRGLSPEQRKATEAALSSPRIKVKIKLSDIDGLAKRITLATSKAPVRAALLAIDPTDRLRLDAKQLAVAIDGQKEAPKNGAERNEIRSIMRPVLEELRHDNPELTMADLQAVLWYPEKTLYDTARAKVGVVTAAGYENDEAPDYANAAVALARSEGVSEEKISAAVERAARRVAAGKRTGPAERAAGEVRAPVPEDGAGFPLEDGLVSEGAGTLDPMTLQQFGGTTAAARLGPGFMSRLQRALDMETDGADPRYIWSQTGWMRGHDLMWRFEIDDSKAKLIDLPSAESFEVDELTPGIDYAWDDPRLALEGTGTIVFGKRLSDVLNHPKLFAAYPELANYKIFSDPMMLDNEHGYHVPGMIVLNPGKSMKEQLSTLLHEIQHAIQVEEGFVGGANTSVDYIRNGLGLGKELDETIAYYTAIDNGEVPGVTFPQKMDKEGLEASAAYDVYQRVGGEVEARNTQNRQDIGTATRREWFPLDSEDIRPDKVLVPVRAPQRLAASQSTTGPAKPRGEATFFPSGKTVIQLFAKADFSTMLHELSHVFLQQEFTLAKEEGASEELKADVAALTKWFGDHGGALDKNGMPDREAHELFARTGERYFREGKAPSAELRSAFTQFKTWLISVYKTVKDLTAYGKAPITPEIREIMDRMIATEDAIEVNATAPMSQADLGMTTAEYDAYLESVQAARDAGHDTLLERMMKAIVKREKGRIAEQRANVRAGVAEQVNADPRFVALHLLRTGRWLGDSAREITPIKLNTGWLIDNYGEEVLKLLPVGLQPLHRGDGVVGDDVADLVGMPSGDALVQALLDLKLQADKLKADGNPRPLRDQMIEDETNRVMADRHGDPAMSMQEIEEEAIAALNSARQGEVLATELRQLKKTKGKGGAVTPYQMLREWARRKVNEGTVDEAVSKSALQRYIRGFNKARNAFEAAILDGKSDEAIKQKQHQMINHALLAEGKVVADEINAIVRRMKRYAKTKALASIDQDYMDRIHELLEAYNFRSVTDRARAEQASFEAWAEGQRAMGHEVHVPIRFRDERTNWKDARVSKLLELNDMVQSLIAQGRLKQTLVNRQAERALAETIDDVESRILALPARTLPASSTGQEDKPFMQTAREEGYRRAVTKLMRPGARVREAVTGLLKIEGLMDILDGTKDGTGPLNQFVVKPATEAANTFSTLTEEVMAPIIARYKSMSKKHAKRLQDFITISELTLNRSIHEADQEKLGQPLTIPRMKLIGLLLNTGNLSNMSKLVGGEGWGDPESATDMDRVRQILLSYASKEDLDLVQDIWNGVSKLWPHIARVERELSGIVPEEVVPTPFDTPFGTYSGGYWPVVWDSTRSEMGRKTGEQAESALQGVGFGIATPKGHTITRTGAMAPMEWSVEHVLFGHMNKVISRIAYAPWVRDTLKIVDSARVTGAIRLRLGNEYVAAIKPWIKDQIPSNMADIQGAKFMEKWLTQIRVNMSIAVLGISYTTGLAQTLGMGYSAGTLGEGSVKAGAKWMALGIGKTLQLQKKGWGGAQEFVFARSEEMRRRAHEVSQESAEVFRRLRDQDTVVRRMQAAAFWHIGFIDLNMVAIPTWMGGYHKALSLGLSEEDAISYAEKVVRLSQSSGRQKDLSAIQRGNAGQKFVSMFYTPSSVFFNQQWEGAQHLKAGNWSKALAPTFWFLAMTSIMEAMMSGDWPEDDDEDGLGGVDIAEWVGRNLMFGLFYGIPIARDAANAKERIDRGEYAEYGTTPLSYASQTIARGYKAGSKAADGEDVEGKDVKAAVSAVGFLLGLPGNQIGKTTGYIKDVYDGKIEPDSAYDWYKGITSGKATET